MGKYHLNYLPEERDLPEESANLKLAFEEKKKAEIKIEKRPVAILFSVLYAVRTVLCIVLAAIGLLTFLVPSVRTEFVYVIGEFIREVSSMA